MNTAPDSPALRSRFRLSPVRESLPGLIAFIVLMGLGKLAGDRNLLTWWWAEGNPETRALLVWNLKAAGIGIAILTILPFFDFRLDPSIARRVVATSLYCSVGLKIGLGYLHLCLAGSRLIEGLAMLGTPLAVVLLLILCKRIDRGCIAATIVMTVIWFATRP